MSADRWNPAQYERYRIERAQPFYDLAALVRRRPDMRVIDLGCGPGRMTAWLHETLRAAETVGVDRSPAMLAEARRYARPRLRFEEADIASLPTDRTYDLVFSNAALQWVPGHEALLPRLAGLVAPGGQIAVQAPANHDHPTQRLAEALATEPPFREALDGFTRPLLVLEPAAYAHLLHRLGFRESVVRLQVYGHLLPETGAAVDWLRGSLLTAYEARLPADLFARFVDTFRARLLDAEGDQRPYYFTFNRILLWGRRPRPA